MAYPRHGLADRPHFFHQQADCQIQIIVKMQNKSTQTDSPPEKAKAAFAQKGSESLNEDKKKDEQRKRKIAQIQKEYKRIGDKFYKEVFRPDKFGVTQRLFVERKRSTIALDFGAALLRYIPAYEDFCIVPSHINYQAVINGFFNEYYELSHVPKEGTWDTIQQILTHVFGEHINFIMDYLHLMYVKPTQRLPVLLLESKEKNTGKSTFGTLIKHIFEDNAIKVGNSDFESDFNAIWIKKTAIIVDETSLDKKGIMQQIKRLSTEVSKVTVNEKNTAQSQVDFFGKFIFMSNDEGKALPIEPGDPRFAVFKVLTFNEKGVKEDPNIDQKIISEIPAFLYHLKNMTPFHPEKGRMYFSPDVYRTKQLQEYYDGSKSKEAKAICEFLNDSFDTFTDQEYLYYSASDLIDQLAKCSYLPKTDRQQIKKAVEAELQVTVGIRQRYDLYCLSDAETTELVEYNPKHCNNRPYKFSRADFKKQDSTDISATLEQPGTDLEQKTSDFGTK